LRLCAFRHRRRKELFELWSWRKYPLKDLRGVTEYPEAFSKGLLEWETTKRASISPFVGEREEEPSFWGGRSYRKISGETTWCMRKDSTGGRGQIFKDLNKSSGGTTFSHALAKLRVEELTEKREGEGRGL
jgi:hypothetical protein